MPSTQAKRSSFRLGKLPVSSPRHQSFIHEYLKTNCVFPDVSALKSPQILELSGIGRKEVLEQASVPVKIDLPGVGENIQDHGAAPLSWSEVENNYQYLV